MRVLSYGDSSILIGIPSIFTLMASRRRCDNCNDCNDCNEYSDCGLDYGECDPFSACLWNTDPGTCNWDCDDD